jgi:phosphoserine phosphatase RsbU/P
METRAVTLRALLVDDEAPARDRLRRLLEEGGVQVVGEASDGEEALSRVAELSPDLVFLDIQMPGLSGLDVAASLRPPRPRIVFCTAFDEFAIQAFEHQALAYLLKPVGRQRLAAALQRVTGEVVEQRLRAREDAAASATQARLMPAAETASAMLACAAMCLPAGVVGGDYYDVLPLGPGLLALTVGDTSGKGIYAGLLTAALQGRIQAVAARGVTAPAALLREVNGLTVGRMEGHRFTTVFFGRYDEDGRLFECASAGHPPALLVGADGAVRRLEAGGPAIGWLEDATYAEDRVTVGPGDTIVVYSDGISEARNPAGDEFGVERLADVIREGRGVPPRALIDRVKEALEIFAAGTPPDDDRTLLVARVTG